MSIKWQGRKYLKKYALTGNTDKTSIQTHQLVTANWRLKGK